MCVHCGYRYPQKRGIRRGKIKYWCKQCSKWFQINRSRKINWNQITLQHLCGISLRSLASQHHLGLGTIFRGCHKVLDLLPHCADVTRDYCASFCGILLVDGKYLKVKGYDRKIPVLYGVDYLTHDIPHYNLSIAENYQTCQSFFTTLRLLNYPLQAVVCDDNRNIYQAAEKIYPKVVIQLCQNHYKQNVRQTLGLSQDKNHLPFMKEIEILFSKKRGVKEFQHMAGKIYYHYGHNELYISILTDIARRSHQLNGYVQVPRTPRTNNLIECYNSHLEGRLKTIKGFKSFKQADLWLNGYFIKRRMQKFTDCSGKFKRLNGKTPLSQSQKPHIDTPTFF